MPCLIWRSGEPYRPDKRLTTRGEPLRQAKKLSFLSTPRNGGDPVECSDFLYDSQTSVCVTGWDTVRWTAICLMDTYFDEEVDVDPLMLSHYDNDPDNPPSDALSLGHLVGDDKMPKDPRAYFLFVCTSQLSRIYEEWRHNEYQLKENVNQYVSSSRDPRFSVSHRSRLSSSIALTYPCRGRGQIWETSTSTSQMSRGARCGPSR